MTKEFLQKTQSLVPGSAEYETIRNEYMIKCRELQNTRSSGQVMKHSFDSSVIHLITKEGDFDGYYILTLLKYSRVAFFLTVDNTIRNLEAENYGFPKQAPVSKAISY